MGLLFNRNIPLLRFVLMSVGELDKEELLENVTITTKEKTIVYNMSTALVGRFMKK